MGISFDAPLALLLLPPLIGVVIALHVASRRRLGVGRRRAALAIRLALLSALVFALAGFQLVLPVDRLAVVYVVDLSDSVGTAGREEALARMGQALDSFILEGVTTTSPFLSRVIRSPAFVSGQVDTRFLERESHLLRLDA